MWLESKSVCRVKVRNSRDRECQVIIKHIRLGGYLCREEFEPSKRGKTRTKEGSVQIVLGCPRSDGRF